MVEIAHQRTDGRVVLVPNVERIFEMGYAAGRQYSRLHPSVAILERYVMRNYASVALRHYDIASYLTLTPVYIEGFEKGLNDEYALRTI